MSHLPLNPRAERDIDRFVERLLKDIDVDEPPLRLELVRDRLELDRAYFSTSDGGAVLETIHRLKVAGKQVIKRPALLWDAIKKWDLKALYVPDRKRILIDADLPPIKQRWNESHEIGHSLIPWHESVLHGDRMQTPSLEFEMEIEAEANFARNANATEVTLSKSPPSHLFTPECQRHGM